MAPGWTRNLQVGDEHPAPPPTSNCSITRQSNEPQFTRQVRGAERSGQRLSPEPGSLLKLHRPPTGLSQRFSGMPAAAHTLTTVSETFHFRCPPKGQKMKQEGRKTSRRGTNKLVTTVDN